MEGQINIFYPELLKGKYSAFSVPIAIPYRYIQSFLNGQKITSNDKRNLNGIKRQRKRNKKIIIKNKRVKFYW